MESTEGPSPKGRAEFSYKNLTADEALTYFALEGGVFWHAPNSYWCAIEPGGAFNKPSDYATGATPEEAVQKYYLTFGLGHQSAWRIKEKADAKGSGDASL